MPAGNEGRGYRGEEILFQFIIFAVHAAEQNLKLNFILRCKFKEAGS